LAFTRNPFLLEFADALLLHQTPQKHQGFRVFSVSCLAETRRVRLIKVKISASLASNRRMDWTFHSPGMCLPSKNKK